MTVGRQRVEAKLRGGADFEFTSPVQTEVLIP